MTKVTAYLAPIAILIIEFYEIEYIKSNLSLPLLFNNILSRVFRLKISEDLYRRDYGNESGSISRCGGLFHYSFLVRRRETPKYSVNLIDTSQVAS